MAGTSLRQRFPAVLLMVQNRNHIMFVIPEALIGNLVLNHIPDSIIRG